MRKKGKKLVQGVDSNQNFWNFLSDYTETKSEEENLTLVVKRSFEAPDGRIAYVKTKYKVKEIKLDKYRSIDCVVIDIKEIMTFEHSNEKIVHVMNDVIYNREEYEELFY